MLCIDFIIIRINILIILGINNSILFIYLFIYCPALKYF